jgi:hypothetical protein
VSAGDVCLEGSDGAELAEMLSFFRDWLGGADHAVLADSLARFVGTDSYELTGLRADLARFVFLLGADDGQALFDTENE